MYVDAEKESSTTSLSNSQQQHQKSGDTDMVLLGRLRSFSSTLNPGSRPLILLLFVLLIPTTLAFPDGTALVPFGDQPAEHLQRPHQAPRIAIGAMMGMLYMLASQAIGVFGSFLGLSMGVTSVVWVMMRNSPEVQPKLAWIMFGSWLFLFLTYVATEARRVALPKLYIFLTLLFGWICMCITATLQKSSFDAIAPPVASFSAYVVAFLFPVRQRREPVLPL